MALLIPSPEIFRVVFHPNPRRLRGVGISPIERRNGSNSAVRVCARVRDCEVRDSDGQFSTPLKESSKPSKEEEERQSYYVNVGYAIRYLREEFPKLFYEELSFGIYREDIVFKDPLNTFIGIENYKSIFWALRFHGRIFFKALWIEISSVWQPMDDVIMIRWTIHGIPRVPLERRGRFDGTSVYKLDKKGKIYEHRVDNIALNSPPKFKVLDMEDILQSLGCPSTPKPTYFESSSTPSSKG